MLQFKKLTLTDMDSLRPYFEYSITRTCDNTPGTVLMWRDYFNTEYTIFNDTLLFKTTYKSHPSAFTLPMGKHVDTALLELKNYCVELDIPFIFCVVTNEGEEILKKQFSCNTIDKTQERDWFDYLYTASDLATFTGHKYNGQRNHINYFKRTFPNYRFEPITQENLPDVKSFFEELSRTTDKSTRSSVEERTKVFEVLENYSLYSMLGGVLYAENNVTAFAIGECVRDTLYVHIEKADAACRGSYQMIVGEFAKYYVTPEIQFINREEDVGDEGLRRSKLSYHPLKLIEKYTIAIK